MTRFARATGSKSSNQRIPNEATPWSMLKRKLDDQENLESETEENEEHTNWKSIIKQEKEIEKNQNSVWCDFEDVPKKKKSKNVVHTESDELSVAHSVEESSEKNVKKVKREITTNGTKTNNDLNDEENIRKKKKKANREYEENEKKQITQKNVSSDFEVCNNTYTSSKNIMNKEFNAKKIRKQSHTTSKVNRVESGESMERKYDGTYNKVNVTAKPFKGKGDKDMKLCYLCKKSGHKLSQCPKMKGDIIGSGCYKCGELGHSGFSCQVKSGNPFRYATCLVCKKKGHIAKQCANKLYLNRNFTNKSSIDKSPATININGQDVTIMKYDGFPIKKEDAERIEDLRKELIIKGVCKEKIKIVVKKERRNAEKSLASLKKKVCFHCREGGHTLSFCPRLEENGVQKVGSGICYKCGSTEHTYLQCRVATSADSYKFATCFICKEGGHIARQCPDNPRGLYPKGGGCKICGDVTHFKKDCPNQESKQVKLNTIQDNELEELELTDESQKTSRNIKRNKIVKFL